MTGLICVLCLAVLCLDGPAALSRQKRIVGGQTASPPPPGASEDEDIVENPALLSLPPVTPPAANSITTTTRRPAVDDDDGPIVFLRRGRREARVKGMKESDGVYAFKGIRYAQPPVGTLRFQRPISIRMEGDVNATAPGPPCPQTLGQRIVGSEDCLFLNIFSPEIPTESAANKYPVIFWIHGGGYRRGSASQYGVSHLVKKGLVVVTVQYRLGSLGFLSNNRKELPGNAGLFDMAASLRWVRRYVQFFGGDPQHIIPSGQDSGASSAIMLTLAHFTKSWIKGVFAMSGSAISSFAVDQQPEQTAREVSAVDNCKAENEPLPFVRCMQKLPLETIIRGDDKVQEGRLAKDNSAKSYITSISKLLNPGPAVEGEDDFRFLPNFLTNKPVETLERGDFAKVPILTGVTKDETSTSAKGGGIASKLFAGVENAEEFLESLVPQLLQANTGCLLLQIVKQSLTIHRQFRKRVKGILGNTTLTPLVNQLFSNNAYVKGIKSSLSGAASTADKLIEMTTDALFNLPAFLTTQYWSKKDKAYLYSFEHDSRTKAADDFLIEHPLTDQTQDAHVEGVGHGDDLVYLFDVLTIDGQPIENEVLTDPNDLQVREHFTNLVAEFARSGVPKINGKSVNAFTTENGEYVIVSPTPSQSKGFRKCQMGLWAGLTDILKSAECSFLQLGDLTSLGLGKLGAGGLPGGAVSTLNKPIANQANALNNITNKFTGLFG